MVAPKARGGIRRGKKDVKGAVDKIKRSPKAKAELQRQAKLLAAKANATLKQKQKYPDYEWSLHPSNRNIEPKATVFTRSNHAKRSNAKHNTLVKLV